MYITPVIICYVSCTHLKIRSGSCVHCVHVYVQCMCERQHENVNYILLLYILVLLFKLSFVITLIVILKWEQGF